MASRATIGTIGHGVTVARNPGWGHDARARPRHPRGTSRTGPHAGTSRAETQAGPACSRLACGDKQRMSPSCRPSRTAFVVRTRCRARSTGPREQRLTPTSAARSTGRARRSPRAIAGSTAHGAPALRVMSAGRPPVSRCSMGGIRRAGAAGWVSCGDRCMRHSHGSRRAVQRPRSRLRILLRAGQCLSPPGLFGSSSRTNMVCLILPEYLAVAGREKPGTIGMDVTSR